MSLPPIGIMGPAGHGKSTVARILSDYGGRRVIPFAEPIKQMLGALGLSHADLCGDMKDIPHPMLCGKSPRQAMQTLGTEWGRNRIGNDFWVRAWRYKVEGSGVVRAIADDVRFPNEVETIRDMGGAIWLVTDSRKAVPMQNHVSEEHWRDVTPDIHVINDGSIDELKAHIDFIVRNAGAEALAP